MKSSRSTTRNLALVVSAVLLAQTGRPGVMPDTPWTCPADHPIKGYVTMGARHVYYVPGDQFYEDASPERCYATEQEAQRDDARPPRGGDAPLPANEVDHVPWGSVT